MGNVFEIDLGKYGCTCMDQEDGGFLEFMNNTKKKQIPYMNFKFGEKNRNLNKSNLSSYTEKTYSQNSSNSNKKYESITILPKSNINSNLNIDKFREESKRINEENENTLINCKNYLKEFEYSETENSISNNNTLNVKKNRSKQDEDENEEDEEEDIQNFNSNTDYFQLANQIADSINELKLNVFNKGERKVISNKENLNIENFENAIKKAGKVADTICFNDVIGCIKKISDINSEVILLNEKIYLGIVNKFKKKYSITHFINFSDEEKIVEIPHFDGIKYDIKKKLGKFNNPKFKFNKFILQGSFPNEILIWKLISQNMEKIRNILKNNYYCCVVLLHKEKGEEENEIIIYLINKIGN